MVKSYEALNKLVKKKISEAIRDDKKWDSFLQTIKKRGYNRFANMLDRKRATEPEEEISWMSYLYQIFVLECVCDSCEYNPKPRRGIKRYSKKEFYECDWVKTQGDILAKETGSYSFDDPKWTKKFDRLSKIVLEKHTDRTKKPEWLDEENNYCPNHYTDLTKP